MAVDVSVVQADGREAKLARAADRLDFSSRGIVHPVGFLRHGFLAHLPIVPAEGDFVVGEVLDAAGLLVEMPRRAEDALPRVKRIVGRQAAR